MQQAKISIIATPRRLRLASVAALLAIGTGLFLLPAIPSTQAEFNLNFRPDEKNNNGVSGTSVSYSGNDAYVSCYISYLATANCGNQITGSHDDASGFYQRMFQDTTTSKWYYQVIIGDYYAGDNFAMEYIIEASAGYGTVWDNSFGNNTLYRSASAYNGTTTQNTSNVLYNMVKPYDTPTSDSLKTGTGTGNPTKIIMHQFLRDADSEMVFLKDTFANKPLMTQITKDGTNMVSTVVMDARALAHNNMNAIPVVTTDTVINFSAAAGIASASNRHTNVTKMAGAGITNTVTVAGDPRAYGTEGDYNYATDNELSNPTVGRYTYTDGTEEGGSNGTYSYWQELAGDTFQPSGISYADFCDPAQNPNWSGNGACKNRDGTTGTRRTGWGGGMGGFGW